MTLHDQFQNLLYHKTYKQHKSISGRSYTENKLTDQDSNFYSYAKI